MLRSATVTLICFVGVGRVLGQDAGAPVAGTPRTVSGQVVDALHGTPVPRALVRLNSQAVLTDARGHFEFPQFTDAQAFASVVKPGYAANAESTDGPAMLRVTDLDASITLQLYPDCVVTGTVTGRDGLPLAGVGVQLMRANYDPSGLAAVPVRVTSTDLRGMYRFREPAGQYRVSVRYTPSLAETSEAVLPEASPAEPSGVSSGYFVAKSGQERHVDLRPFTGPTHPLDLMVEGLPQGDGARHNLRVTVFTRNGEHFDPQAVASGEAGHFQLALPAGSYELRGVTGVREGILQGTVRIAVSAREPTRASLRMQAPVVIPIDATFQVSAQSQANQQPRVEQLNLSLRSLSPDTDAGVATRPQTGSDGSTYFLVLPGRYRLTASGSGAWNVQSASLGTSNLLTDEILVGEGAQSGPILVRASNASGQVSGTVRMPAGGTGWLYLIPQAPGLTLYTIQRMSTTGTFNNPVPPGPYLVAALTERVQEDLRDPKVVNRLAALGKTVVVTENASTEADVTLSTYPAGVR